MTPESRHISVVIERPVDVVYAYAADPTTLSTWAAGLANAPVEKTDDGWAADSPMGRVLVEFAERNHFGVLDHVVTLPTGERVYNPFRVIPYGDDCEVVFTVRRRPDMSDDEFEQDAAAVAADLATLKQIMESR